MANQWFRLYAEMIHDPKVGTLTDSAFRTWIEVLCLASQASLEGDTDMTIDEISWTLRRNVTETLHETLQKHLLVLVDHGDGRETVAVKNWSKRQFLSDSSAERVKKHRAKQKQEEEKQYKNNDLDHSNDNVTKCNVTETLQVTKRNALDTDTDTDTDTEKEIRASCPELPLKTDKDDSPIIFNLPLNQKHTYHAITQHDIDYYTELYPAVDVSQEIRKMIGWLDSNQKRRKTKTGIKAFITNWLAKEQDRNKVNGKHYETHSTTHQETRRDQRSKISAAIDQHHREAIAGALANGSL